jgi:hypothetical protein
VNCAGLRPPRGTAPGQVPGLVREVTVTISVPDAAGYARSDDLVGWCAGALAAELRRGSAGPLRGPAAAGARAVTAGNGAGYDADEAAWIDEQAGGCSHAMETAAYQVRGRLRRWLTVRDGTCRNPVCRQPAGRCDQDHVIPYGQGGRSCGCNLGGQCRFDHQLRQLPNWHLTMDPRGTFTWRTPAGRVYRKHPHRYTI